MSGGYTGESPIIPNPQVSSTELTNPMTTAGDSIVGGAGGVPARLALGTAGHVRRVNAAGTAEEFAAAESAGQPLDSDLTAIAALTTTAFGRAVLALANAGALATYAGVGTGDSPTFAGVVTPTVTGPTTLTLASGSGSNIAINPNGAVVAITSTGGAGLVQFKATTSSGYCSFDLLDMSGSVKGGFGYANTGVGGTLSGRTYFYGANIDVVLSSDYGSTAAICLKASNGPIQMRSDAILGFCSTANATGTIDVARSRNAAGVEEINNGTAGTFRDLKLRNLTPTGGNGLAIATVGTLPVTAATGQFVSSGFWVTDALAPVYGSPVAAGGSAQCEVRWDGTNWIVS